MCPTPAQPFLARSNLFCNPSLISCPNIVVLALRFHPDQHHDAIHANVLVAGTLPLQHLPRLTAWRSADPKHATRGSLASKVMNQANCLEFGQYGLQVSYTLSFFLSTLCLEPVGPLVVWSLC